MVRRVSSLAALYSDFDCIIFGSRDFVFVFPRKFLNDLVTNIVN